MPRRTAADRFSDLLPPEGRGPGEILADEISALSNARRRELVDLLNVHGPASVGKLAEVSQMAVGSVSHHVRVLARAGLVEPAPEYAADTRESWWRTSGRSSRWSSRSFREGTAGEQLARLATTANLDYLIKAVRRWDAAGPQPGWEGTVVDVLVNATPDELAQLGRQMGQLVTHFAKECRTRELDAPEEPRRPVRLMCLVFPEVDLHG